MAKRHLGTVDAPEALVADDAPGARDDVVAQVLEPPPAPPRPRKKGRGLLDRVARALGLVDDGEPR